MVRLVPPIPLTEADDDQYFALERGLGAILPVVREGRVIGTAANEADAASVLGAAPAIGRALLSNPTCRGRWVAAYDTDAWYDVGAVPAAAGVPLRVRPEDVGLDPAQVIPARDVVREIRRRLEGRE